MIIVIVLVVVALLSLAAYTFAELMVTHYGAATVSGRHLQARAMAESGAEAVRFYLMQNEATRQDAGGHFDNPSYFQGIPVLVHEDLRQRANFTVLVPNLDDEGNLAGVRYGLEDESTRLNVNALLAVDEVSEGAGRDLLMGLPGMTEDVADAILDWIDEDEEPREYGAESDYYQTLDPPYLAKNGPLDTVEEILLVRGVEPALLFGTDTNRNGMVDPHESNPQSVTGTPQAMPTTGTASSTSAEMLGGSLDRGWSGYLTLYSLEKNVNAEGVPRINLNGEDLEQLYGSIAELLNEDWAKFIVYYRQYGAYDGDKAGVDVATAAEPDFAQEAKVTLTQVLDLIGKEVQIGTGDNAEVLTTPFAETLAEMSVYLPVLMDNTTITPGETIPGRININQASRCMLLGIPGVEESVADEIINQRVMESDEQTDASALQHETWILTAGIVTLDEMKTLLPFVCAGGDVYRAQIVGYYEDGGAASRAEVVFDATGSVPRIVSFRDISHLGRGYPLELLGVQLINNF